MNKKYVILLFLFGLFTSNVIYATNVPLKLNGQTCTTLKINKGWNMISIPLNNASFNAGSKEEIRMYTLVNSKMINTDKTTPGKGYWLFSNKLDEIDVCGQPVYQVTWNLSTGKFILGGPSEDVKIQDILNQVKNGKIKIYEFDPVNKKYIMLGKNDVITQGKGYFVDYTGKGDVAILGQKQKIQTSTLCLNCPEIQFVSYVKNNKVFVDWWPADNNLNKYFIFNPYLLDNKIYHGTLKISGEKGQVLPGPTIFSENCSAGQIEKRLCTPLSLTYETSITDNNGNIKNKVPLFIKLEHDDPQEFALLLQDIKSFCENDEHDCNFKTFKYSKKLLWININWKDFNSLMNTLTNKYSKNIKFSPDKALVPQLNETVQLIHADDVSLSSYPESERHGSDTKIAIIDTGADETHGDLNSRILYKHNIITDDDNITDVIGHGTFMASVVAGTGIASGGEFTGVAPESDLIIVKVDDDWWGYSITESNVISGIDWALGHNPDVILIPLTINDDIVDYINSIRSSMSDDEYPVFVLPANTNYDDYNLRQTPFINHIGSNNFISVGASSKDVDYLREELEGMHGEINMYGSGPTSDFLIEPDVTAPGEAVIAAWPKNVYRESYRDPYTSIIGRSEIEEDLSYDTGNYTYGKGISISAAHVAGAAAIIKSIHPDWTYDQIRSALITSADYIQYTSTCERQYYCSREAREENATLLEQGTGRINVERALNVPFYTNKPVLSFGRISTSTTFLEKEITLTAYEDEYIDVTVDDPINTYYQNGGTATVTIDSSTLSSGESTTVHLTITDIPDEYDGFFYGYVHVIIDGEEYNIPYLFTKFHEVNLIFKTNSSEEIPSCGFGDVINFYSNMTLSGGTSPGYYRSNVDLLSRYFLVYNRIYGHDDSSYYCGYNILLEPGNYTGVISGAINGDKLFLLEKDFNITSDDEIPKWVNITLDDGSPHHIQFTEPGTHIPLVTQNVQIGYAYHRGGLRTTACYKNEPRPDCYDDAYYNYYLNIPKEFIFYLSDEKVHSISPPSYVYKRLSSLVLTGVPYIDHGYPIDYDVERESPIGPLDDNDYRSYLAGTSDRFYYINLLDIPFGLEMDDYVTLDDYDYHNFNWKTNLPGYFPLSFYNYLNFANSFGFSAINYNTPANDKTVYYIIDTERINYAYGKAQASYNEYASQGENIEYTKNPDDFYNKYIRLDKLNKKHITFLQTPYYYAINPSFTYSSYDIDWAPMTNDWTINRIPIINYGYYTDHTEGYSDTYTRYISLYSDDPSFTNVHVEAFNSYPLYTYIHYNGQMTDCWGEPALPPILKINAPAWFNTSMPYNGTIEEVPVDVTDGACTYDGSITGVYYSCGLGASSSDWYPVPFSYLGGHIYSFEISSVPCTDYMNFKVSTLYNLVDEMNYTVKPMSRLADDSHLSVDMSPVEDYYPSTSTDFITFTPYLSWTPSTVEEPMDNLEIQVWLCDHKIYETKPRHELLLTPNKIYHLWDKYCNVYDPRYTPRLREYINVPLVFKFPSTGTYPENNETIIVKIRNQLPVSTRPYEGGIK